VTLCRVEPQEADPGDLALLRTRSERRAAATPPSSVMNVRGFIIRSPSSPGW
jgi:hypothetical protein